MAQMTLVLNPEGLEKQLGEALANTFQQLNLSVPQPMLASILATTIEVLQTCTTQVMTAPTTSATTQTTSQIHTPKLQTQQQKRKTYTQPVFQKRDKVEIIDAPPPRYAPNPPDTQTQTSPPPSKFVRQRKPPREAQRVTLSAFWIIDTPDPRELSYKDWRVNLYEQGAPQKSIIELRHPLRNVLEVITTEQHVEAVMNAASKLNNNIKQAMPYTRVWEAAEPLTMHQIQRMATSYARGIRYSPSHHVRQYLQKVALVGANILQQSQELQLAQSVQDTINGVN